METLKKNRIFIFPHNETKIVGTDSAGLSISEKSGHQVSSYEELVEKLSALNFYNPSLQIYFRGQTKDYSNFDKNGKRVRSNLYPSLLRGLPIKKASRKDVVKERIKILKLAEELLKTKLKIGYLHKHQLVRWASSIMRYAKHLSLMLPAHYRTHCHFLSKMDQMKHIFMHLAFRIRQVQLPSLWNP